MIKPYLKYQAVKFTDGIEKIVEDNIAIEKGLQISINDKSFSVVMQTPGNEIELACGLLFSEDIISKDFKPEFQTEVSKDGFVEKINCHIPIEELGEGYKGSRSLLSVSSCGICGKQKLEDINLTGDKLIDNGIEQTEIFEMMSTLKLNQSIFKETGAVHGSALFNSNYELIVINEDVGRHNSFDKAIGDLLQ
jgi:FdhD protein